MIQHLHIVDVFVVPHCFPSFLNYGGLLIVTLFGNFGSHLDTVAVLVIAPCSNFGVVICAMLKLFWSLFQSCCCCLCDAHDVLVIVCAMLLLLWLLFPTLVLLFVQYS